jgi:hypothetical protein
MISKYFLFSLKLESSVMKKEGVKKQVSVFDII